MYTRQQTETNKILRLNTIHLYPSSVKTGKALFFQQLVFVFPVLTHTSVCNCK